MSYVSAKPEKEKGANKRNRWRIGNLMKHGKNFTISTELFTVKFAGNLQVPRFQFWYNAADEQMKVYQVFFHKIFEFDDIDGDGIYDPKIDSIEPRRMLTLPSADLSLVGPENITDGEDIVGIRFNYTITGGHGQGRGLNNVTMILQCSLYEQDYGAVIEGVSYNVTGGAELKIDVIIESWPFKDNNSMLCLKWSINQQNMTLTPLISENCVTFGRGYFSWISEATVYNETHSETVPVTGSFIMTGRSVNVYLSYPNFQNKSLIHDPSIGVISGEQSSPYLYNMRNDADSQTSGETVSAQVGGTNKPLPDQIEDVVLKTLGTLDLDGVTFAGVAVAEKDGYALNEEALTLTVQSAIECAIYALVSLAVTSAAITGAIMLRRKK
jgi:hypothetical protein